MKQKDPEITVFMRKNSFYIFLGLLIVIAAVATVVVQTTSFQSRIQNFAREVRPFFADPGGFARNQGEGEQVLSWLGGVRRESEFFRNSKPIVNVSWLNALGAGESDFCSEFGLPDPQSALEAAQELADEGFIDDEDIVLVSEYIFDTTLNIFVAMGCAF